uniref:Uncharacterized protein n=1 Tax=Arundo donax TaxID=35708 RepID=A0A0A9ELU8_ARUDO
MDMVLRQVIEQLDNLVNVLKHALLKLRLKEN